jgi:hypothetical protein
MMKKIVLGLALLSLISWQTYANNCTQPIDLVFAFDASGSIAPLNNGVRDYSDWKSQIDFANALSNEHLIDTESTHVAAVSGSGCSSNPACDAASRFVENQGLTDNESVISELFTYGSTNGIGETEFIAGLSWTDERLGFANDRFQASNRVDARKIIVLFSDTDATDGHEMCDADGYVSPTLAGIQAEGVDLFLIMVGNSNDSEFCATQEEKAFRIDSFSDDAYQRMILENYDGDLLCGDSDDDSDNDGVINSDDQCPLGVIGMGNTPNGIDLDGDGCVSSEDEDDDNDGVSDDTDAFPEDISADTDTDNDGAPDAWNAVCDAICQSKSTLEIDVFPSDAAEKKDSDEDGIGDNADAFPYDASADTDTDNDGAPDRWNQDCGISCQDSSNLVLDAFPENPLEQVDSDKDGVGDNSDFAPKDAGITEKPKIEEDESSGGSMNIMLLMCFMFCLIRRRASLAY